MKVYLDNAATTPVAPEVAELMCAIIRDNFGNPSSTHAFGRESKGLIENSRRSIAQKLNCKPGEIIFTSGGTEADNFAFHCAIRDLGVDRIITSPIEHHAVLHSAEFQEMASNKELVFVQVDNKGNIDLNDLETLLMEPKKTFVSIMHANNEIGTKIDLEKVSKLCREHGAYFHSDTVQTMGHYAFDLEKLDIDFITCAAHKLHGPKGVGFLYINKNLKLKPMIHGGSQERGMRGGTENLYGIVGMAKALDLAYEDLEGHIKHVQGLKTYMIDKLRGMNNNFEFHGEIDPEKSLYTVLNICFPPINNSELLLLTLDLNGVACSGGSACTSGANTGSHVLGGINAPTGRPNARFSFSRYTTKEEIDYALEQIQKVLDKDLI
ncbi:MAG: cysteine desulfurase [Crocinitomicaceae bacterium]|nr:cysteine desulfurase [Crocinitomicaceae bacterium]